MYNIKLYNLGVRETQRSGDMASGHMERREGYPSAARFGRRKALTSLGAGAAVFAGGTLLGRSVGGGGNETAATSNKEQQSGVAATEASDNTIAQLDSVGSRQIERSDLHASLRNPDELASIFASGETDRFTAAFYTYKDEIMVNGEVDPERGAELFADNLGTALMLFTNQDFLKEPYDDDIMFAASRSSIAREQIVKGLGGYVDDTPEQLKRRHLYELFPPAHATPLVRYCRTGGDPGYFLDVRLMSADKDPLSKNTFKEEDNQYLRVLNLNISDNYGDIIGSPSQNIDIRNSTLPVIIDTNHPEIVKYQLYISPTSTNALYELAQQR